MAIGMTYGLSDGTFPDILAAKQLASATYLPVEGDGSIEALGSTILLGYDISPPISLGSADSRGAPSRAPLHPVFGQNVVGVGVGEKMTGGEGQEREVVRFYVVRKFEPEAVPGPFRLPARVNGFETDVIESGDFWAVQASVPGLRERWRPARPGCSIGFNSAMAGTFGALVRDASGEAHILSCAHVLADSGRLPTGSPIFQPGLIDKGDPHDDQIGTLSYTVTLNAGVYNRMDCALARPLTPDAVISTFVPPMPPLVRPDPIAPRKGLRVHKIGRTTGLSYGVIVDPSVDIVMKYPAGKFVFRNQILVQGDGGPFSAAGDSGALLIDVASNQAVGLHFGAARGFSAANPLVDVLGDLAVTLIP